MRFTEESRRVTERGFRSQATRVTRRRSPRGLPFLCGGNQSGMDGVDQADAPLGPYLKVADEG